jgi:hypothetical protein
MLGIEASDYSKHYKQGIEAVNWNMRLYQVSEDRERYVLVIEAWDWGKWWKRAIEDRMKQWSMIKACDRI